MILFVYLCNLSSFLRQILESSRRIEATKTSADNYTEESYDYYWFKKNSPYPTKLCSTSKTGTKSTIKLIKKSIAEREKGQIHPMKQEDKFCEAKSLTYLRMN